MCVTTPLSGSVWIIQHSPSIATDAVMFPKDARIEPATHLCKDVVIGRGCFNHTNCL